MINNVTNNELDQFWNDYYDEGVVYSHYVEVDLEGDARFIGPMTKHQAELLEYYWTSGEAFDNDCVDDCIPVTQAVAIVDKMEYDKLVASLGGEDPMLITLSDYIAENEDLNDFLRNR